MRSIRLAALIGVFCILGMGSVAGAALITGAVTGPGLVVQDYSGSSYQGSGTDMRMAYKTFDGVYNSTNMNDMWLTNRVPSVASPVSIDYNFNARWNLSSLDIWNYNEIGVASRGFKDVSISVSNDWGRTWSQVAASTLTQAPGSTSYGTPDAISLAGVQATNLRITATSKFGSASDAYSGLSEVQIFGNKISGATKISPANVTPSSAWGARTANKTYDGYRYDNQPDAHMWLSNGEPSPTIQWDLGSVRPLHHLNVFNYNESGGSPLFVQRGIQSTKLEYSADGSTWQQVGSGNLTLPQAKGTNDTPGYEIVLGGEAGVPARYVRMTNVSNFGGHTYTGLQEVEFYATAPANLIDLHANHAAKPASRYIHAVNGSQFGANAPGTYDGIPFGEERSAAWLLTGEEGPVTLLADAAGKLYQTQSAATPSYFNFNGDVGSSGGLLVDLGQTYFLDAIQMYGYNIADGGTYWFPRSLKDFTIWTADDPAAVQITGDKLFVADLSKFTQQGGTQTLGSLAGLAAPYATYGDTFLFGGATQPWDVGGAAHAVTAENIAARYLFFRDMSAWYGGTGALAQVGLGEVRFYGTPLPEPSSLALAAVAALGLVGLARRRRRETV